MAMKGQSSSGCVFVALLCGIFFASSRATLAAIPQTEHDGLVACYNSMGGPSWTTSTGWLGAAGSECSWFGVTCDKAGSTVINLRLGSNNLAGTIPPQIESLNNLTDLELYGTFGSTSVLTGPIPVELGNLTKLIYLDLDTNALTGPIPAALSNLTNLGQLYLYTNQLSGSIPAVLAGMPNLQTLDLSGNQLTGDIPAAFGTAKRLTGIILGPNNLTPGSIPDFLQDLPLVDLGLDTTNRTGDIPAWLGTKSTLLSLELSRNSFTAGPVPDFLSNLHELQTLGLTETNRTGDIPAWISGLTQLTSLRLSYNAFNPGALPDVSKLSKLFLLSVQSANRTGAIPDYLGSLSNLAVIYLSDDHFTGNIPTTFSQLSALAYLCLSGNQLGGGLPFQATKIPNIQFVDLRWNAFQTGDIRIAQYFNAHAADCVNPTVTYPVPIQEDFRSTQTTPPRFGLSADSATSSTLSLHWNPIRYTADNGFYAVFSSTSPNGPWNTLVTRVPKTASGALATGLKPGTTYYFTIITVTLPHSSGVDEGVGVIGNSNTVRSIRSAVFSGTTTQ